jgi:hypothetical protein
MRLDVRTATVLLLFSFVHASECDVTTLEKNRPNLSCCKSDSQCMATSQCNDYFVCCTDPMDDLVGYTSGV